MWNRHRVSALRHQWLQTEAHVPWANRCDLKSGYCFIGAVTLTVCLPKSSPWDCSFPWRCGRARQVVSRTKDTAGTRAELPLNPQGGTIWLPQFWTQIIRSWVFPCLLSFPSGEERIWTRRAGEDAWCLGHQHLLSNCLDLSSSSASSSSFLLLHPRKQQ